MFQKITDERALEIAKKENWKPIFVIHSEKSPILHTNMKYQVIQTEEAEDAYLCFANHEALIEISCNDTKGILEYNIWSVSSQDNLIIYVPLNFALPKVK